MKNNGNDILHSIINTFNLTTSLPIICLNLNGKLVTYAGLTEKMINNLDMNEIYKRISVDKLLKTYNTISYLSLDNSLEASITLLTLNNSVKYYFILGPYKSNINLITNLYNNDEFKFIPRNCIKYLTQTLKNIIDDQSSFKRMDLKQPISLNIRKAIEFIHKNYEEELTIDLMAETLNINKCYFCSIFKKETGLTFSNFLNKFRIEKSKELLKNTSLSVLDIAISVGFNNQNYYSMVFKKELGISPLQYKKDICIEKRLN